MCPVVMRWADSSYWWVLRFSWFLLLPFRPTPAQGPMASWTSQQVHGPTREETFSHASGALATGRVGRSQGDQLQQALWTLAAQPRTSSSNPAPLMESPSRSSDSSVSQMPWRFSQSLMGSGKTCPPVPRVLPGLQSCFQKPDVRCAWAHPLRCSLPHPSPYLMGGGPASLSPYLMGGGPPLHSRAQVTSVPEDVLLTMSPVPLYMLCPLLGMPFQLTAYSVNSLLPVSPTKPSLGLDTRRLSWVLPAKTAVCCSITILICLSVHQAERICPILSYLSTD